MKPILFNTDMVRAILDGRKTVMRRVVKPQPNNECTHGGHHEFIRDDFIDGSNFTGFVCKKCGYGVCGPHLKFPIGTSWIRPPYRPGDILYVRETFSKERVRGRDIFVYKTGDENAKILQEVGGRIIKWTPSIHMPREAARIFLRVTSVSVERLQDCGKGWCLDIETEGITAPQNPILYISDDDFHDALREEFKKVWNSTIKRTDRALYGWDANPYVWCVSFERISKEEAYKRA